MAKRECPLSGCGFRRLNVGDEALSGLYLGCDDVSLTAILAPRLP